MASFLAQHDLVNGISLLERKLVFNRTEDLAAKLITYLKMSWCKNGEVYVQSPGNEDSEISVDYCYEIIADEDTFEITMKANGIPSFEGTPSKFCKSLDGSSKEWLFEPVILKKLDLYHEIERQIYQRPLLAKAKSIISNTRENSPTFRLDLMEAYQIIGSLLSNGSGYLIEK